ncbi:NAD-dependent epimerase/dehydratase family protein [Lutimonas halocynthiae]|uniref:NAD-dependent epimerase/dehydratase family protein n=1 Tax=Lutimonas halocynthiae TaxID=1446477 RepID=UPI0025B58D27|nr:NAD-dependent epimerase/dehydratase family protein [Lutimonas halocynthiae]MDN3642079.1 NAD-dependent epimerase/dehydratase family protein [Lutimonas halocynthiae]
MKVLFIGGTGNISMSSTKLALERGIDIFLLTRGKSQAIPKGVKSLILDINDEAKVKELIKDHHFDAVVNWIAFSPEDIKRDFALFRGKTNQYIFISSASCYQKPLSHPIITESTPLANPFWDYSRQKIACEDALMGLYRNEGFPITIVRPSLTYDTVIPVPIGGWTEYTIVDRIKKGKKIIIHGDGTSLWTITHAKDFAVGFMGLIGHQQAIGQSFHITSDEILTWNQIYEAVAMAAGRDADIVHISSDYLGTFDQQLKGSLLGDKAVSTIFDNSKIHRFVPEFNPCIRFKDGILNTIKWFEETPERMIVKDETNEFMDRIIKTYLRP